MTERMTALGFKETDPKTLGFDPFTRIGDQWMLITAGDENGSNTMTASWGGAGIFWGKPAVVALIRKSRYTKGFVDGSDCFTLSFFPADKKQALVFCGSKSGRDFEKDEKAKKAGLTALYVDGTTAYEEAELILVCRKMYSHDMNEDNFIDKSIVESQYSDNDWHTAYVAEITAAYVKR